jgi:hypothetical protein
MEDIIQVQDQYYILASASKATDRTAVLQHGDTFAVFDLHGDIGASGPSEQGLYHEARDICRGFACASTNYGRCC